jgi:histidinol phosphatase-like enzyme/predicted kinase
MGLPGAGKTTIAQEFAARGYLRLNRDDTGGTLRNLVPEIDRALAAGASRLVLDNTYVSRKSRAPVVEAAGTRGVSVRCLWLTTSLEDAQVNAASRIIERYGRLLDDDELIAERRHDVAAFPPTVQFRYHRELEPPDLTEGFAQVETVTFERRVDPSYVNRAVIVWCDGILTRSRSGQRVPADGDDVIVDLERAATLRRYQERGFRLLGLSWQPEIDDGTRTAAAVDAVFGRMKALMDIELEVEYCSHGAGPPRCWCRKPLPGLGVLFIHRHQLNPATCVYVGEGPQDPGFARRLGFTFRTARDFFEQSHEHDTR